MFYDLNLGVDGVGDQSIRELVAMAMRLGYSGVAFNHIFTGIMADSDRCKLRPLELRSILSAAPGVAEAAKFHRQLLGVPTDRSFRQFTRITVVVDNPAQASALNSGNPVLKTYDLVAVRPTNQKAFNQACLNLDIDLISLDASQRLPFRLKMTVVKAAIERGVYFEVSYGRTITDSKARREFFANAQALHAAARGRNIIVSSEARRVLELRGPNDAANLSTLFGLTLESAKNAVSRNCKAVLMHGVMRKATYRNAIHIETTLSAEKAVHPENLFDVPMNWDPLSLGGAALDFISMDEAPDVNFEESSPDQKGAAIELLKVKPSVANRKSSDNALISDNATFRSGSKNRKLQGRVSQEESEKALHLDLTARPLSGLVASVSPRNVIEGTKLPSLGPPQQAPSTPAKGLQEVNKQKRKKGTHVDGEGPEGQALRKKSKKKKRKR